MRPPYYSDPHLTLAARHQRITGHPITLTAHHDVLVFRTPDSAEQVLTGLTTAVAGLDAHHRRRDASRREAA